MLEKLFPNLTKERYAITSPMTIEYNSIAWAFDDTERCWWPDPYYQYYWPPDMPRVDSIENFVKAFERLGYIACDNSKFEKGFEKVAIYANQYGKPTHAARQLESGIWTSKLGKLEDISHDIDGISGNLYGNVVIVLKRAK